MRRTLEHFPAGWNTLIEKEMLRIEELDSVDRICRARQMAGASDGAKTK